MENNLKLLEAAPARLALPISTLIDQLRATGRDELIHYAGAAHRDAVAWHLCAAYIADPTADEAELKSRALKAAWGMDVSPEAIREVRRAVAGVPDFVPAPATIRQRIPVIRGGAS